MHPPSTGLFTDVDDMPEFDLSTLIPAMVVAEGIHNPPLSPPHLRVAQQIGSLVEDGLRLLVFRA